MNPAQINVLLDCFTRIAVEIAASGKRRDATIERAGADIAQGLHDVARAIGALADAIGADGRSGAQSPNEAAVDANGDTVGEPAVTTGKTA